MVTNPENANFSMDLTAFKTIVKQYLVIQLTPKTKVYPEKVCHPKNVTKIENDICFSPSLLPQRPKIVDQSATRFHMIIYYMLNKI